MPGGCYARFQLRGPSMLIAPTFVAMQRDWLPHSGFELDHRPLIERYVVLSWQNPVTELLFPVRPRTHT